MEVTAIMSAKRKVGMGREERVTEDEVAGNIAFLFVAVKQFFQTDRGEEQKWIN